MGEMPQIEVYSIVSKSLIMKFEAHANRVRCMTLVSDQPIKYNDTSAQLNHQCLVTASNDGFVKVWKLSKKLIEEHSNSKEGDNKMRFTVEVKEEAKVDTKCRITCLKVHRVPTVVKSENELDESTRVNLTDNTGNQSERKKKKSKVQIIDSVPKSKNTDESSAKAKKPKVIIEDEMTKFSKNAAASNAVENETSTI